MMGHRARKHDLVSRSGRKFLRIRAHAHWCMADIGVAQVKHHNLRGVPEFTTIVSCFCCGSFNGPTACLRSIGLKQNSRASRHT